MRKLSIIKISASFFFQNNNDVLCVRTSCTSHIKSLKLVDKAFQLLRHYKRTDAIRVVQTL